MRHSTQPTITGFALHFAGKENRNLPPSSAEAPPEATAFIVAELGNKGGGDAASFAGDECLRL